MRPDDVNITTKTMRFQILGASFQTN